MVKRHEGSRTKAKYRLSLLYYSSSCGTDKVDEENMSRSEGAFLESREKIIDSPDTLIAAHALSLDLKEFSIIQNPKITRLDIFTCLISIPT
jgi:hypothetical protein